MLPAPNELSISPTTESAPPTTISSAAAPTSGSSAVSPSKSAPAKPNQQPAGGGAPANVGRCGGFPAASCTGVPAGTAFKLHNGDLTVTTPGTVIDGMHITGDLLLRANNVTIRNSQIDGQVSNYNDVTDVDGAHPFTIRDSTVGDETCKSTGTAIGTGNYTAERVHIRGFGDAFRAGAPNVTVRDSYVKICTNDPESHADGIQDYPASGNLVFDHNTIDECGGRVPTNGVCDLKIGYNSPIFVHSNTNGGTKGARITNNLVMGGVYSLFLWPQPGAAWVVTGNRIVQGTWTYGPAHVEGLCGEIDQWADNTTVAIDANYRITSTVSTLACPS